MYEFLRDENLQDVNVKHNLLAMDNQAKQFTDGTEHAGGFILLFSPHSRRVLLGLRSPEAHFEPNTWNPLGGTMESNECPILTAMREIYEEGRIAPSQYKLIPHIFHLDLNDDEDGNIHRVYTYLGITNSEIDPTINHEHTDACWFHIDDLPKIPLFLPLKRAFQNPNALQLLKQAIMDNINFQIN